MPIIDANPRGGEKIPFAPTQARRLGQRSASARVKSLLKERHGERWVRGRGAAKVMCHLMFGWVALTATALFARRHPRLAALTQRGPPAASGGASLPCVQNGPLVVATPVFTASGGRRSPGKPHTPGVLKTPQKSPIFGTGSM